MEADQVKEGDRSSNPVIEQFLINLGEGTSPEDHTLLATGNPREAWKGGHIDIQEMLRKENFFLEAKKRQMVDILRSDLPWVMGIIEVILEEISTNAVIRQFRGPSVPDVHTRKIVDDCLKVIRGEVPHHKEDPKDMDARLALSLVAKYLQPLTLRSLDSTGKDNSFSKILGRQEDFTYRKQKAIGVYEALTGMFPLFEKMSEHPLTFWAKRADPEYYARKEYEARLYTERELKQ